MCAVSRTTGFRLCSLKWCRAYAQSNLGQPFNVAQDKNQPIFVDVHVPKGLTAGTYTGSIHIAASSGGSADVPLSITVWHLEDTGAVAPRRARCSHYCRCSQMVRFVLPNTREPVSVCSFSISVASSVMSGEVAASPQPLASHAQMVGKVEVRMPWL